MDTTGRYENDTRLRTTIYKVRIRIENAARTATEGSAFDSALAVFLVLFDDLSGNNLPLVDLCK